MVDETLEDSKTSTILVPELAPFDPTKKKKKKKKRIRPHVRDPVHSLAETAENLSISDGAHNALSDNYGAGEVTITQQLDCPWEGTDRDYTYDELLGRVFHTLHESNPEISEDRPRTILRPPQVLQEGTSITLIANFMDYCKTMHRQLEHVMSFMLEELGTSGYLDDRQRLVLRGRFAATSLEAILRSYINEYVLCSCCRSPDTAISRENGHLFLRCEQCGSERSVTSSNSGYIARVKRRTSST